MGLGIESELVLETAIWCRADNVHDQIISEPSLDRYPFPQRLKMTEMPPSDCPSEDPIFTGRVTCGETLSPQSPRKKKQSPVIRAYVKTFWSHPTCFKHFVIARHAIHLNEALNLLKNREDTSPQSQKPVLATRVLTARSKAGLTKSARLTRGKIGIRA